MANPLKTEGFANNLPPLRPGESRTYHGHDKQGNIVKTFTVHRTERPYAYDLCDAYNAARPEDVIRRGLEWYVTPAGELKLGESADWSRQHTKHLESQKQTESAVALRRELEAARRAA